MFASYVAEALKDLKKQSYSDSLSDLLQEATEIAYEQWDRDMESEYFQGE
jgi:predicted ATP-dependent Lon-type protease